MNIGVFNQDLKDGTFKVMTTADLHCPCCGRLLKIPTDMLVQRIADKIEEHYRENMQRVYAENKRLREIIEFGNQIELIKRVSKNL